MVYDTKLYDLLGVSPDVNEQELRKAYHKKARELHPDHNKSPDATEKFQQVNEAYEILKDQEKRQIYDKYGPEGIRRGGGGGSHFEDIFQNIFRFDDMVNPRNRKQRTSNIVHQIQVQLEDLYNGKEVILQVNRNVICSECGGKGCENEKSPMKCPECNGRGQRFIEQRMGFMIQRQIIPCSRCNGTGEIIEDNDKCKHCHGQKVVKEKKRINVHIEPGMEDGEEIKFPGCSDEAPNAETGDLIIVLNLKKNNHFIRKHNNLLMTKKIKLTEALTGCKFTFDHLDGRKIVVSNEPNQIITPDSVKIIHREGMPKRGNQFEKGDLYIKFEVEFPKSPQFTNEFISALKECIPPSNEVEKIDFNRDDVYQVEAQNANIKQFENSKSSYKPHDYEYNTQEDNNPQQEECIIM